jgi:hypothetical protein
VPETAELRWRLNEGFYLYQPDEAPRGPIQTWMMLEVVLQELEHDGWQQIDGRLGPETFSAPADRPRDTLVFKRQET